MIHAVLAIYTFRKIDFWFHQKFIPLSFVKYEVVNTSFCYANIYGKPSAQTDFQLFFLYFFNVLIGDRINTVIKHD